MRDTMLRSITLTVVLFLNAVGAAAQSFHLLETSIEDIHAAFASKRLTCRELVNLYIKRIEAYDKEGPRLNAVQTVRRCARRANSVKRSFAVSMSCADSIQTAVPRRSFLNMSKAGFMEIL